MKQRERTDNVTQLEKTMSQKSKETRGRRNRRGMTLIEIMVVITILGMIVAAIGVAVIPQLNQAKIDKTQIEVKNMKQALDMFYAKKGKYPDTGTGLKGLLDQGIVEKQPVDPWGNDYVYMLEGGKPVITSYGADGSPGGEGKDKDISTKDEAAKE